MDILKNYWWILITIPLLTFVLYVLAKTIKPRREKVKEMTGISIIAIIWGIITLWLAYCQHLSNFYVFSGVCFILIGGLRLLYDYKLKK